MPYYASFSFLKCQISLVKWCGGPIGEFFSRPALQYFLIFLFWGNCIFVSLQSLSFPEDQCFDYEEKMEQVLMVSVNSFDSKGFIELWKDAIF